jgi:hypothetical protein
LSCGIFFKIRDFPPEFGSHSADISQICQALASLSAREANLVIASLLFVL